MVFLLNLNPITMIYISDLQQLITSWQQRMTSGEQPIPYRDALNDCIYELNQLISRSLDEELSYREYIESWKADDFLDSHAA